MLAAGICKAGTGLIKGIAAAEAWQMTRFISLRWGCDATNADWEDLDYLHTGTRAEAYLKCVLWSQEQEAAGKQDP